jgi:chromate transporter
LVEKKQWVTMDEVMDYFAISQCTPGIIAVNAATFVGYKRKGIAGGIFATLGLVIPSFLIISAIALSLENFSRIEAVQHAFAGIRVAVGALILDAVVKLFKGSVKDIAAILICAAAFLLSVVFKTSPVWIVFAAALAGFLLYRPKKKAAE